MDKSIQVAIRKIKTAILLAIAAIVTTGVVSALPCDKTFLIDPESSMAFTVCAVMVISFCVLIPSLYKLFELFTTRQLRRMNMDEALAHYVHCSLGIVIVPFILASLACIAAASLCGLATGYYVGTIYAAAILYSWPKADKIKQYLDTVNDGAL